MTFRIGVPSEIRRGENRVAMTPEGVSALKETGADVLVQAGAGRESGFPDAEYAAAGASIVSTPADAWNSDLVVKVKEPLPGEYAFLSEGTAVFAYLHLAALPDLTTVLLERGVTGIAYETVSVEGTLPLLRPMSEVAGVLAVQAGARGLEKACGGRGVLLAGVGGVPPSRVVVVGAGCAGTTAARTAAGMGADVVLLDISRKALERAEGAIPGRIRTVLSTPETLSAEAVEADLLISSVLGVGGRAPVIVPRRLLKKMKPGAVVVDIAIDQGGSIETSRPTTHDSPYFLEEGIVHYCVSNMPGAVPRTSTAALAGATLPYVLEMARSGIGKALRENSSLRAGLNTYRGKVTCGGVAKALGRKHTPPEELLPGAGG